MIRRLRYIGFMMATLLLLGGMETQAWATTVTYHILTRPFDVKNKDNSSNKWTAVRVEALRCTSTEANIGLPAEFISPLAKNFNYYRGVTCSHPNTMLYDNDGTSNKVQPLSVTYDIFEETDLTDATLLDLSSPVAAVDGEHIYVTYEYIGNDPAVNTMLLLDGSQNYNIQLTNNRYLCLNRSRNNRPGAANAAALTEGDLASDDFVLPPQGTRADQIGFNWSTQSDHGEPGICLRFKFVGEDPYNVTIMTAYTGSATYSEKLNVEGTKYKKPYAGSTLFAKMKNDGTTEKGWLSPDADRHYKSTTDATDYDSWQGFYRGDMNPIFNSVAVLPKGTNDYMLVASKMNQNGTQYQPNSKGQYAFFSGSSANDPVLEFKDIDKIPSTITYEIYTYTFKVKTPFGNILTATREWSEADASSSLKDHVPDALLRKYVTFTGAYAEIEVAGVKQADTSIPISSFADADNYGRVIWLEYTTSMPFETLPVGGCYNDSRYYTIRINGASQTQNIGYYSSGNFYTGLGSNTDLHQGENSAETQVAFIGDPFELKIISRAASEAVTAEGTPAASHNRYIGCATDASDGATLTVQDGTDDISTWQIEPGDITTPDYFVLRQYNTDGKYIGWNSGDANRPMTYSTTSATIRVVELEKKNYVYHIVRGDGTIAVKATDAQDVGTPLRKKDIPDIIHSPFIDYPAATVTFYSNEACTTAIRHAAYAVTDANKHIYVKYNMNGAAAAYLDNKIYHVLLNGEYIYYDNGVVKSKAEMDGADATSGAFKWQLSGNDPYAMTVQTMDADHYGHFVEVVNWATGTISNPWPTSGDTKFIVKLSPYSSSTTNVYEVMAATGEGIDASATYYNMGRLDNTTVKMVDNETSAHGSLTLRFRLFPTGGTSHNVTYHLIDKEGVDLVQTVVRHVDTDAPDFPAQYRSPLVTNYHYYVAENFTTNTVGGVTYYTLDGSPSELATIGVANDVYVLYNGANDVSNQYDLQNKRITYLLKYKAGTPFRAEDGSDGLEATPITPVYPYCNGDCCFFIYGQAQFNLQQEGAASTRTRWAWYLESANNDPYHVKICSRQQETYNQDDIRGYFATYQPDDYDRVITTLVWPTISGIQGTDYMILGTTGNFLLVTAKAIPLDSDHNGTPESTQRYTVKSFEQYWKTFDTVKKKILDGELGILADKDKGNSKYEDPDGSILVPTSPASYRESLTGLSYNYHSYKKWAYAKHFNGYNKDGETKKGWEELEHWFQTIDMGEGYFSLEAVDINPVLILLDQHGWEIMRKPLPTSPTDPTKAAKYNQIRPYNSPMVEKYYFWTKASKRTGFHQYYSLSQQVTVDGEAFTSQSLTDLPPYETSANIKDAKGNLLDQYVTYTVKDEYVKSYNPNTKEGAEFLIQQGSKFASYNGTDLLKNGVPSTGGMQQYIIENIDNLTTTGSKNELWYVKPNARIDYEMGYVDGDEEYDIVTNHDWTDADGYAGYTDYFSDGFDPYNIQISSVPYNTQYFVTNATGATLSEGAGSLIGVYSSDPAVSIREPETNIPCTWYDSRALAITNATFMAVQDANGNMQLMPRFDQSTRMKDFSELVPTTDAGIANTYTKLYRPLVYNYHIIDNEGNESLRYRSGGDLVPQIPNHFKSPLAKDFTYYKTLTNRVVSNEITASMAGAELTDATNNVYVRYSYDKEADELGVLQGRWLTIQLNNLDAQYTTVSEIAGVYADNTVTPAKPATIDDDADARPWQWKFLKTPQTNPDPYAVQLFNRNNPGDNNELPTGKYFAILSHTSDGFALAEARTTNENYDTYYFLNGGGVMDDDTPAAIARESGFLSTSCSFSGTNSLLQLLDEVEHTFTYKIYTKGGIFAISAEQDNETLVYNEYMPELPLNIKSPLLNMDQFRYYEQDLTGTVATADTLGKSLDLLYGLYDDVVYVHYTAYDPLVTSYKVPNERNATGTGQVERANTSNDASIDLSKDLLYNIIWYNDNMMTCSDGDVITDGGSHDLMGDNAHEWQFDGNDPYAITIHSKLHSKYVYNNGTDDACTMANTGTPFMLLPMEGHDYGVLRVTGGTKMLSGFGNTLTSSDPTKFIIFLLSTHKVTYHLVIAKTCPDQTNPNTGEFVDIPYRAAESGELTSLRIYGSSQRDLSANAIADVSVGHISLGDQLKVPTAMYRPNVDYEFYVQDIYDIYQSGDVIPAGKAIGDNKALNETLNSKYKGLKVTAMGKDEALLGKSVVINIHYAFKGGLETNVGADFVRSVAQNKWYTFEAKKNDGTPQLMQYTNAWGMEVKEGRGTHYTNDYLWTPLGDPYGFKMYHRYTCVNSGEWNDGEPHRVMTTIDNSGSGGDGPFVEGKPVTMGYDNDGCGVHASDANSVYELLEARTPGYFKIHPVANNAGTQYYLKIVHDEESPSSGIYHDYVRLTSDEDSYTEFTFGLSTDLVKPYYDRHGYVGGLKDSEYNTADPDKKAIVDALKAGKTLTSAQLMTAQSVVYHPENIVQYTPGYYRLHSPEDIDGVTVRYVSGYTHKTELDYDGSSADANGDGNNNYDPLPMHFYERKGVNTTFEILGINTSPATRGAIPISEPAYDPASIFRFEQVPWREEQGNPAGYYQDKANMAVLSTQGLYVKGSKGPGNTETSENGKAVMIAPAGSTPTSSEATPLFIMDIGGGIMLIHDQQTADRRVNLKYLSFDQSSDVYDLKLTHNTHTDYAKWLMEPANAQGLTLEAHSGFNASIYGDTYYHTTFCAPFDVYISGDKGTAYTCDETHSPWPISGSDKTGYLHPKPIGDYNTGTYKNDNNFIPAGTPVLIATTDNSGTVKLTIPTTSPSSSISTIFSGEYLEQKLDAGNVVYTFGLPFTSTLTFNESTGEITGTLPQQAETGVGFYINANPNKELGLARAEWVRNNRYVIHNKIYYRAPEDPSPAPGMPTLQFVPVLFDEGGEEEPGGQDENENNRRVGDGCVYDILGRKVASAEEVKAGTWYRHLSPGVYIVNGQKVFVGVGRM